jgi:spore germination protein YaaH
MAGEVWNIPNVGSVSTPVGAPCLIHYTVQQGDTLTSIAERYHIPLDMLVFANYGCYGYNAHYDTWYAPPVAVPYSTTSDYATGYGGYATGCVYTGYPTIYAGNVLVIPVTPENVSMRP